MSALRCGFSAGSVLIMRATNPANCFENGRKKHVVTTLKMVCIAAIGAAMCGYVVTPFTTTASA